MSFKIVQLPVFEIQLKRLSKKYPSIADDLRQLMASLQENPLQGIPLGRNCYKIRIKITAKGRGKSGGGRVITCILIYQKTVVLLSIYDKSEKQDIADKELKKLINQVIE